MFAAVYMLTLSIFIFPTMINIVSNTRLFDFGQGSNIGISANATITTFVASYSNLDLFIIFPFLLVSFLLIAIILLTFSYSALSKGIGER